ncbi:MAG: SH3 domain-containing protein [Clostridiaceae bacterium]
MKKVLLQTGVALVLTMSSVAVPMKVMNTVVAEASVLNSQSGNLTVTAASLWAYSAPNWTAKVRTYSQGTVLQVVEKHSVDGREMYKLSNGYYISANPSYVSFSSSGAPATVAPVASATDTRITTANLNMRSGAGAGYGILLTIPKGTTLTVQSISGSFAKVSYGGKTGYASLDYLQVVSAAAPVAPSAPVAPVTGTDTRMTTANLNMRSGAGTTYGILLTIPKGTTLSVQALSGSFAKVSYGGKTGYVSTSYLQVVTASTPVAPVTPTVPVAPPTGTDTRMTTGNLNMRSGAGTTYGILLTIPKGTTLSLQSVEGKWAKVSYGGKTGYVSTDYLQVVNVTPPVVPVAPPAGTDTRMTTGNLNMRSGAGTTFSILLTIPKGTTISVQSVEGKWAKVSYGGKTGYVSTDYLQVVSVTPPVVPETPVTPPVVPETPVTPPVVPETPVEPETPPVVPEAPKADIRKTTYNLNLRSGAGTTFSILLTIPSGTELTIESLEGSWAKVSYGGKTGYVSVDYLQAVTVTDPVTPETPVANSVIKIESPTGTKEYSDLAVKGYVLTNAQVSKVSIVVNGLEIGLADINLAREDIKASNPEYANAATSGFQLVLNKDRFNQGSNIIKTIATLSDGTTTSATVTITYNRPDFETKSILDKTDVTQYKNEDITVSGYARIDTGVKSVKVLLNGRTQGSAKYGILRSDAENSYSGFEYVILRNNLFPGENTIKVEITGNGGETVVLNKVINVEKIPTIVIDAGHGGKDSGARGLLNGAYVYEKNYVIQFAKYLNEELLAAGFKTIMTRSDDTFIELEDRAKIANNAYADLFFSIHHDYSPVPTSQGAFVIYPSVKLASISESTIGESIDAAGYIKNALVEMGFKNRNNGTDQNISGHTLAVLRQTNMRSILAEIGYMSNASDMLKITDPMLQRATAKSLSTQIKAYFGMN